MAGTRSAPRLSREVIVESALALADAEGLGAVTIRRLASDHGVTPMALYWHFKDKELLLDGVAERVLGEVEIPVYDGELPEWHVRLRDVCTAILGTLNRHPGVADLVRRRFMGCAPGLDLAEIFFAALRDAGFDRERIGALGMQVLHNLVVLVTVEPGERTETDEEVARRIRRKRAALEALEPERYPNIVACADILVNQNGERRYLELGLDVMIGGIRAMQAELV